MQRDVISVPKSEATAARERTQSGGDSYSPSGEGGGGRRGVATAGGVETAGAASGAGAGAGAGAEEAGSARSKQQQVKNIHVWILSVNT